MEYILIKNQSDIKSYESALLSAPVIAINLETTGLDPHEDKIRLIELAIDGLDTFIIDTFTFLPEGLGLLKSIMESKSIKVFQNGKFHLQFLLGIGIRVPLGLFDTMVAAQLLRSSGGPRRVSLDSLVNHYLGENLYTYGKKIEWSEEITERELEYVSKISRYLLRLRKEMFGEIKKNNLVEVVRQEFYCVRAMAEVEYNGIYLNLESWKRLTEKIEREQELCLSRLYDYVGTPKVQMGFFNDAVISKFNMNSNKQILSLLNNNDIPVKDTSRHSLAEYQHVSLVKDILEYRRTSKLLSTFLYSMPYLVHSETNRLHPKYAQIGAYSGRMSCGGPNIQQIPRSNEFRDCFAAEEGNKLIIADYSQIELRIVAEISRDRRMIDAYKNGEDLHRLTASLISGKSMEEVTKDERQAAKAMNFGLVFAMGASGLQSYAKETYDVDMTLDEAEEFRNRFFKAYEGVKRWHRELKRNPYTQSYTVAGRKHVYGQNSGLSGLCNTPVQGSAADIVKNALGMLVDRLVPSGASIVAIVHDEIVIEAKNEYAHEVSRVLKETMEEAGAKYLKYVPVVADVKVGDTWSEK